MSEPVTKLVEQEALIRKILVFKIAFIRTYRKLLGSHAGFRDATIECCMLALTERYLGIQRDVLWKALNDNENYNLVKLRGRGSYKVVQRFLDRNDMTGAEKEIFTVSRPIKRWITETEMTRAHEAVLTLKSRACLPGFAEKYHELKRVLEKTHA